MDDLLAYLAKVCPGLPLHSVQAEQRLARKAQEEAVRYLDVLTPEAQAAREKLEKARTFLAGYPKLTDRLSTAAKAKRVNEHTNPAHKWVALAIVLAGLIAAVYGVIAWRRQEGFGMYFTLLGLAVVFLFSGTQVIPTMKNNKRAVTAAWEQAQKDMESILDSTYAHGEKLDAVLSPYDGITQGVANAIESKRPDMKPGTDSWPYITGQDAMEISIANIANGKQGETVFKDVNKLANAVEEMIIEIAEGKEVSGINGKFNNGNLDVPSKLLDPQGITIDNLSDLVKANYVTQSRFNELTKGTLLEDQIK